MLKDYLEKNNISIYSLSKDIEIAYSTLNDICNGKVDINNCKVSIIKKLAKYFNTSMDEMYNICLNDKNIQIGLLTKAEIYTKNKSYYVKFRYDDKDTNIRLCKVNSNSTSYLDTIAEWAIEDYITDLQMEKAYDLQFKKKR